MRAMMERTAQLLGNEAKSIHDSDEKTVGLEDDEIYEESGPPSIDVGPNDRPRNAVKTFGVDTQKGNVLRESTVNDHVVQRK